MLSSTALILALTLAQSSTAQVWQNGDDNGKIQWAQNCDFNGWDIQRHDIEANQCGRKCLENPSCTYFTWGNGICWIKGLREWPVTPRQSPGAVCGWKKLNDPLGDCGSDTDCYSSSCAYWGATGRKACCYKGAGTTLYAGYNYCKKLPNQVSCWTDDQCENVCRGNCGGLCRGTCNP
ncbi:hypothetical protein BJ741DRAFT_590580 [Chytriomyces cf. hyalinus JEL632]|nr:hypothetical protein BJ741DRAFT_590580 [Chytriomyces cf. hyalinus JEL632]